MYDKNLNTYIAELEKLDKDIKLLLADRKRDAFLVYHPAWGYFAEDYGLHEMPLKKRGKTDCKRNGTNHCRSKARGITAVIASPQHSTRSAETIAKQLQAK
jgi:zinc transport system substrate-binding protein